MDPNRAEFFKKLLSAQPGAVILLLAVVRSAIGVFF
jgi:hypothetical protein